MLYIINLILGYVEIQVQSAYTERFLNMLSTRNIPFWNLEYLEYGSLSLSIRANDFKALRIISRRTASKIKILKKRGLPFFMLKFKKRYALLFGVFFFILITWTLSSFIWIIDISGGDLKLQEQVRKQLELNGVKRGAFSYGIDHDALKNDILLNFPELSNITVNINGSHADVSLYLNTPAPEIIDYSLHSNIISDYDGIITSITVTSGTPEVAPGDTVMRGQILTSGYMTGRTGVAVEYRSLADIRARTWERKNIVIPDSTLKKDYTGKEKRKYSLILGKKRLKLYFGTGNFYDSYDKIIKRVQLVLPFGLKLPIYLETCVIKEYTTQLYKLSHTEAENYLSPKALQYITLGEDDRLTSSSYDMRFDGSKISLNLLAECERKIGVEQMIPKGE